MSKKGMGYSQLAMLVKEYNLASGPSRGYLPTEDKECEHIDKPGVKAISRIKATLRLKECLNYTKRITNDKGFWVFMPTITSKAMKVIEELILGDIKERFEVESSNIALIREMPCLPES